MKKSVLIILIEVGLFFLAGCTNEMPFDINENPPRLIMNALLEAEKDENEIILGLTGRNKVEYMTDATINVYLNGDLKEQVTSWVDPTLGEKTSIYKTKLKFVPDDIIKLEAKTNDGKHHIWAEVVVPHPVQIENIDTMTVEKKTDYMHAICLRLNTTFTVNNPKRSFYRLSHERYTSYIGKSPFTGNDTVVYRSNLENPIVNEDVVLTDGRPSTNEDDILPSIQNRYAVFDNSRINGSYTMLTYIPLYTYSRTDYVHGDGNYYPDYQIDYSPSVNIDNITEAHLYARIRLLSITQMQYLYLKALNIYDSVDYDDYFNLPVKFPSNLEGGGTGIVAASVSSAKLIELKEDIFI